MIEAIETWIFDQLSADTTLAALFDADTAPERLIRSGPGEESDPYPAVSFTFVGETEREENRCGEIIRCVLAWDITVKVKTRSFADSQPYATLLESILAPKTATDGTFIWNSGAGALIGRRERGTGRQWFVHHGNTFEFEVLPAT